MEIKKGHELTDISCPHGSRFFWWYDKDCTGPLGEWKCMVWRSDCHCGSPPLPFRSKAQMDAYLTKQRGEQREL